MNNDSHLWTPWRMPYLRGEDRKDYDDCLFCVKGDGDPGDPAFDDREHIIARSAHVYVTLNAYPYNNGHLLIVPYAHVPSIEPLPADALTDLMHTLNRALAALRTVYQPHGFNVGANIGEAAGAGIAEHFHLHVVPRWSGDSNFMTIAAGTRVIPDTLDASCQQLRAAWDT
ncbi:MAG: HIT domain-containing protein [Anaerolineae bacterium]|nr:HIT domain-containing protein [Anaerolineae bacterium]